MPTFWSGCAAGKKFDSSGIKSAGASTIILNGFHGIGKGQMLLLICNRPMPISTKIRSQKWKMKEKFRNDTGLWVY